MGNGMMIPAGAIDLARDNLPNGRRVKAGEPVRVQCQRQPDGRWCAWAGAKDGTLVTWGDPKWTKEEAIHQVVTRLHLWGWRGHDVLVFKGDRYDQEKK